MDGRELGVELEPWLELVEVRPLLRLLVLDARDTSAVFVASVTTLTPTVLPVLAGINMVL
jgi:hypothetical protein